MMLRRRASTFYLLYLLPPADQKTRLSFLLQGRIRSLLVEGTTRRPPGSLVTG